MLTYSARGPPCSSNPADACERIAAGSCADNVAANTMMALCPGCFSISQTSQRSSFSKETGKRTPRKGDASRR
jgi:hypothetical protein